MRQRIQFHLIQHMQVIFSNLKTWKCSLETLAPANLFAQVCRRWACPQISSSWTSWPMTCLGSFCWRWWTSWSGSFTISSRLHACMGTDCYCWWAGLRGWSNKQIVDQLVSLTSWSTICLFDHLVVNECVQPYCWWASQRRLDKLINNLVGCSWVKVWQSFLMWWYEIGIVFFKWVLLTTRLGLVLFALTC